MSSFQAAQATEAVRHSLYRIILENSYCYCQVRIMTPAAAAARNSPSNQKWGVHDAWSAEQAEDGHSSMHGSCKAFSMILWRRQTVMGIEVVINVRHFYRLLHAVVPTPTAAVTAKHYAHWLIACNH